MDRYLLSVFNGNTVDTFPAVVKKMYSLLLLLVTMSRQIVLVVTILFLDFVMINLIQFIHLGKTL